MVTKNFKAVMANVLSAGAASPYSGLAITDWNGNTKYLYSYLSEFPRSVNTDGTTRASSPGISVGTGSTAATENDYNLAATITEGISVVTALITHGLDDGDPFVEYRVTVTNNTAAAITVNEIGYKQAVHTSAEQGADKAHAATIVLLDRTVLSTGLTIAAGESGVINYRLKTELS